MTPISEVIYKFYQYSINNIEWESLNLDEGDETFQTICLFHIDMAHIDDTEETEKEWNDLFVKNNIEYFILEYFSSPGEVWRDFHVFENGEFRPANSDEDWYLRAVEDEYEIYYMEQEPIKQLGETDYFKMKDNVDKSFIKMNETKMKKFNEFLNENKEDGYSKEFDKNWQYIESLVDQILELSDEFSEEELKLMSTKDLENKLDELEQDKIEREIDSIEYRKEDRAFEKYGNTRTENGLRTKIDQLVLYFEKNKYNVELDDIKNRFMGSKEYNEKCNKIIECLKKLDD